MIDGTYRLVYIEWENEYLPIGCLTGDSFSESVEMLDTTTRDNGGWKTSVPTNQSYNISFEGLLINTNFYGGDFTKVSYDRLRELKRSNTLIKWLIEDINKTFSDTGFGYLTNLSDSSSVDEFVTFSATIEGYGEPVSSSGGNSNITKYMTFNTYADMIAYGTPLYMTEIRVLNDENKGLENTTYIWYPDGERLWIASTSDN